jgi:hypothetical protein
MQVPAVIVCPDFKIAAAQIASVRGNIDANVVTHAAAIQAAGEHHVSVLVFPELSLTGYEPDLAMELAVSEDDSRLFLLIALSRQHQMEVVIGAPLRNLTGKPALGAIVITGDGAIRTYRKMHLGGSERTYFDAGEAPLALTVREHTVGIAICADSSRDTHPKAYADRGGHLCDGRLPEFRVVRDGRSAPRGLRGALPHAGCDGKPCRVGGDLYIRRQERGVEPRGFHSGAVRGY